MLTMWYKFFQFNKNYIETFSFSHVKVWISPEFGVNGV